MSVFLDVLNWASSRPGRWEQRWRWTAAWVALIAACGLLCIALGREVRSWQRSRSGPARV